MPTTNPIQRGANAIERLEETHGHIDIQGLTEDCRRTVAEHVLAAAGGTDAKDAEPVAWLIDHPEPSMPPWSTNTRRVADSYREDGVRVAPLFERPVSSQDAVREQMWSVERGAWRRDRDRWRGFAKRLEALLDRARRDAVEVVLPAEGDERDALVEVMASAITDAADIDAGDRDYAEAAYDALREAAGSPAGPADELGSAPYDDGVGMPVVSPAGPGPEDAPLLDLTLTDTDNDAIKFRRAGKSGAVVANLLHDGRPDAGRVELYPKDLRVLHEWIGRHLDAHDFPAVSPVERTGDGLPGALQAVIAEAERTGSREVVEWLRRQLDATPVERTEGDETTLREVVTDFRVNYLLGEIHQLLDLAKVLAEDDPMRKALAGMADRLNKQDDRLYAALSPVGGSSESEAPGPRHLNDSELDLSGADRCLCGRCTPSESEADDA